MVRDTEGNELDRFGHSPDAEDFRLEYPDKADLVLEVDTQTCDWLHEKLDEPDAEHLLTSYVQLCILRRQGNEGKEYTMKNIEKLPKWAQQEITLLERKLREATEERDMLRTGQLGEEGSPVRIEQFTGPDISLNATDRITFQVGEFKHQKISFRLKDGRVDVMGGGTLDIRPVVSNGMTVGLAEK